MATFQKIENQLFKKVDISQKNFKELTKLVSESLKT